MPDLICDVCTRPKATSADEKRHGDECDNGSASWWTHWCQELCWCADIHHDVMATDPSQGPGFCDICKPKPERPKISRPKSPIDALVDAACGITEKDYK